MSAVEVDSANATSTTHTANYSSMMPTSFVTEVLATAGRLEKEDLNAKLGKLAKRIDDVKMEVYESLENQYIRFYPDLSMAQGLSSSVEALTTDMDEVNNKIQKEVKSQLNLSTTEFQDLSEQLEESTNVVTLLGFLTVLHDSITATSAAIGWPNYIEAADHLQQTQLKMAELQDVTDGRRSHTDIKIFEAIQSTFQQQRSELIWDVGEIWSSSVKWTLPSQTGKQAKADQVSITVQCSEEAKNTIAEVAQAMYHLDALEPKLKQFGARLLEHFVKPIVMANSTQKVPELKENTMGAAKELTIKYTRSKKSKKQEQTLVSIVLSSIQSVFQFLHENLFTIQVQKKKGGVKELAKVSLMTLLGDLIAEQLLELIINGCLAQSIPTSNKDLDGFLEVIDLTEILQKHLITVGVLPSTNTSLLEYVNNVNVLFANKKSQEILEKSRLLMTSEIHSMVRVTNKKPLGELPSLLPGGKSSSKGSSGNGQQGSLGTDVQLSASTFQLPDCHISLSSQQLVTLAYEMLNEAKECDEQGTVQLFYTVRSMFDLFCNVVPTHHEESLRKLPQLAALHHNNCMYISHHLLFLGHHFKPHLPKYLSSGATTFVDFVPSIRRLGTECFLNMLKRQRAELMDYLSAANGFVSMSENENQVVAERAIRQAFLQLSHLGNVWRDVLPANIYAKSMGTLVKSVVMELINSTVALDDISADDATQLANLITIITECAPQLFNPTSASKEETKDEEDAKRRDAESAKTGLALLLQNVPKWGQLLELQLLLNASLQDIRDRWAEGKGLLPDHFTANEVKQLIRALFQNTDRRAAVLATIR